MNWIKKLLGIKKSIKLSRKEALSVIEHFRMSNEIQRELKDKMRPVESRQSDCCNELANEVLPKLLPALILK